MRNVKRLEDHLNNRRSARLARALVASVAVPTALLSPVLTTHADAATPGDIAGHISVNGGPANDGSTWVEARSNDGAVYRDVQTDANGDYDFGTLPPASYTVYAYDYTNYTDYYGCYSTDPTVQYCTAVNVHAGQDLTGIDVNLTPPPAQYGTVTGTVTDTSGDPVNTQVTFFRLNGYGIFDYYDDTRSYAGDGSYSYVGLPPGTYRVEFGSSNGYYAPEFWQNALDLSDATDLVVTGGGSSVADEVLHPAAEIAGHVSDSSGAIHGAEVDVYRRVDGVWTWVSGQRTDPSGAYDVWGLPAATYRIGFSDPSGAHAAEYWNDATTLAGATDVTLGDGQSTVADAQLATAGGISGAVSGPDGAAAYNIDVTAYRQTTDGWSIASQTSTAWTGTYTLHGLAPGTYRVGFRDQSGRDASEYWDNARTIAGATDVVVTAGSTATHRDATLEVNTDTSNAVVPTSAPTVVGTAKVGRTLVSTTGTWAPGGVTYSYQWTANGFPIAGATGASYSPRPVDVGKKIALQVTGLKSGYSAGTATSASTAPVAKGTLKLRTAPVVTGKAVVGHVLASTRGSWSKKVRTSFQWFAGSKKIGHATHMRLTVTHSLKGKQIHVQVTARRKGYAPASAASKATHPVTNRAMHAAKAPAA